MDSKQLKEIEAKLKERATGVRINEAYAEGRNHFILKEKATKEKPDHRIPVPLAKMTVDDMTGYAGRSGDRTMKVENVEADTEEKEDPFIEYIRTMDEYNSENIETAELYEESCIQGVSYEIWWASDKVDGYTLTAEYKMVPKESVYIKWSDDIKPEMEYFVYSAGEDKRRTATVYYPLYSEKYVSVDGGEYEPDIDEATGTNRQEHPYKTPPINIFAANRKERPIFEAGKSMIDAYDIIMSRSMNEVERFNSLIAVIAEKAKPEFIEAFAQGDISVIDDQGDSERSDLPKYLQKDFSGINELYSNTMDRLNDDYRKTVKIPDMSDESFSGNESGVAMAYKLISIEFSASKIDTYFNKGMERRLELYADVYNGDMDKVDVDEYKAVIVAKRNIPVDVASIVTVATGLLALGISKEAILEYLPNQIIGDVKKEMARQEEEAAKRTLEYGALEIEETE